MATGSPFTIILNSPGTVLAACPVSLRVSHFVAVHSFGDARSLGDSATLGAKAARGYWPPTKAPAQRSLVDSASALSRNIYRLWCARESVQLANRRIDPARPSYFVRFRSKVRPQSCLGYYLHCREAHLRTASRQGTLAQHDSGYDARSIPHVLIQIMTAASLLRIARRCVKRSGPVAVSEGHTVSDGIMDHKLVLLARNQADKL
jgi:hypothetical protein